MPTPPPQSAAVQHEVPEAGAATQVPAVPVLPVAQQMSALLNEQVDLVVLAVQELVMH
jgi:hypothetical protein